MGIVENPHVFYGLKKVQNFFFSASSSGEVNINEQQQASDFSVSQSKQQKLYELLKQLLLVEEKENKEKERRGKERKRKNETSVIKT